MLKSSIRLQTGVSAYPEREGPKNYLVGGIHGGFSKGGQDAEVLHLPFLVNQMETPATTIITLRS